MFRKLLALSFGVALSAASISLTADDTDPLTGPYMGQQPLDIASDKFASDLVSTPDAFEPKSVFSSEGDKFIAKEGVIFSGSM